MKQLIISLVVHLIGSAWIIPAMAVPAKPGKITKSDKVLHIYSARKEHLIKPVFDLYTKETGVKIQYLTDKAGALLQRLKAEGKKSKADILLTVDAGNLWHAANEGLLYPVRSRILRNNIPLHVRDTKNRWFGFSVRARTIVYNTKKVKASDLSTYEDLATKKWRKRLCLRTSKKVYNQSLVAMLIAEHGKKKAEKIVSGWVKNLATAVFANDTAVIKAVSAGQCDVGIVNTYYFGRLVKKEAHHPIALFWPNQMSSGVHVNVSGGGILKTSSQRRLARNFLEWLSGKQAQNLFADANLEYPANTSIQPVQLVRSWGKFKPSSMNLSKAGELQGAAIRLMNRVRYK